MRLPPKHCIMQVTGAGDLVRPGYPGGREDVPEEAFLPIKRRKRADEFSPGPARAGAAGTGKKRLLSGRGKQAGSWRR